MRHPYNHLKDADKKKIAHIIEENGYSEVFRLLAGLIRNQVPNTLESWQDGQNDFAEEASKTLYKLAQDVHRHLEKIVSPVRYLDVTYDFTCCRRHVEDSVDVAVIGGGWTCPSCKTVFRVNHDRRLIFVGPLNSVQAENFLEECKKNGFVP